MRTYQRDGVYEMRYALYYIVANEQIGLNAGKRFRQVAMPQGGNVRLSDPKDFRLRVWRMARQIAGRGEAPWP